MDERIMKVLEAAGARIADLESDLAEMEDANDYVCGQRDELEKKLAASEKLLADAEAEVRLKESSINFWFTQCNRAEAENKALKAERAGVEAVD